jgi:hypothetical protein
MDEDGSGCLSLRLRHLSLTHPLHTSQRMGHPRRKRIGDALKRRPYTNRCGEKAALVQGLTHPLHIPQRMGHPEGVYTHVNSDSRFVFAPVVGATGKAASSRRTP